MSKVTRQTSVMRSSYNQKGIAFLEEYAEIFGSAIRTGFTIRNRIGKTKESKKPEDCLKSNAWAKVARKINICGARNRHKFYGSGQKQAKANCLLHGKLRHKRSTKWTRKTVQVITTPHIKLKTSATVHLPTFR